MPFEFPIRDPVSKLLRTIDVGARSLTMAQHVVHRLVEAHDRLYPSWNVLHDAAIMYVL
jgi:hypothetical protein